MGHGKHKDSVVVRTPQGQLLAMPREAAEKLAAQQAAEQAARAPSPLVQATVSARRFLDQATKLEAYVEGAILALGPAAPEVERLHAFRRKIRETKSEVERIHGRLTHAVVELDEKWLDEALANARGAAAELLDKVAPTTETPAPAA